MVRDGREGELEAFDENCICVTAKGKPIKPKTVGQQKYIESIRNNTIILGTGPAGTGKTFLAVAMAVKALRDKKVSRIILTRPAIEAGEKLGYLPGDLQSKIDPYLRPLYDALFEMMGPENYQRNVEKQIIEVAPLAYMRGRTLDDAFIILDEAQNATFEQMKMFLTRLGNNSKAVVTGDLTQTDLPGGQVSGLWSAVKILDEVPAVLDVGEELADLRAMVVDRVLDVELLYELVDPEEKRTRSSALLAVRAGNLLERNADNRLHAEALRELEAAAHVLYPAVIDGTYRIRSNAVGGALRLERGDFFVRRGERKMEVLYAQIVHVGLLHDRERVVDRAPVEREPGDAEPERHRGAGEKRYHQRESEY
jgi:phosphate starvation-inducible PhoH-like protein